MRKDKSSKRPPEGNGVKTQALLRWHKLHIGVYARVAKRLSVDSSYVSRVANGKRQSGAIQHALLNEIASIQRRLPRV
jgi:transcriptional regulator with XRE-family HTH domain